MQTFLSILTAFQRIEINLAFAEMLRKTKITENIFLLFLFIVI